RRNSPVRVTRPPAAQLKPLFHAPRLPGPHHRFCPLPPQDIRCRGHRGHGRQLAECLSVAGRSEGTSTGDVRLGLRENWQQFSLLVLLNAFVGGMVGLERTVVPLIGSQEFRIASTTIVVSFIVSFGVVKAFANLVSGHLADLYGRKHLLVVGWLLGL